MLRATVRVYMQALMYRERGGLWMRRAKRTPHRRQATDIPDIRKLLNEANGASWVGYWR